ncbi:hypothetical protein Dvina_12640 [Dactylosporangium vinaceum]|uniref:RyR domain-containing protein n=1 Tax=Dactylosporangium vinaceum TaxID=53362 RepID=A0ABV5MFQ9_9ACTN|nr:RyR domain-containing protein [Dactylosporangium vinaceum]UAB98842.1 hypothetical protein Dvina_12640 [Dactylosporangium vinaceum]
MTRAGLTLIRSVFVAVAVAAVLLGLSGMHQLLQARSPGYDRWDLPYYTLQLFVLSSEPLQDGGPYPWQLEVARFLAPLFTLLTVVETGRVLLGEQLRRLRSRAAREHAVVLGDTPFARALTERLTAAGRRVVTVAARPGDTITLAMLRGAGLRQARHVYVCGRHDETNHAATVVVRDAIAGLARPPWVYVQLNRAKECQALQARRLGAAGAGRFRLEYFHVDDIAARNLYRLHPLHPPAGGGPVRVIIAGAGDFRRPLIVETVARFRHAPAQLRLTVVGPGSQRTVAELAARFPFLAAADIAAGEDELDPGRPGAAGCERLYLCHADEQASLDLALSSPALWRAVTGTIVVVTHTHGALAEAFHGRPGVDLLDEVGRKLLIFPVLTRACDAGIITDDLTERLARRIHERYLATSGQGGGPGWAGLAESVRNANRAQVEGIAEKLRALGCVIAVRGHQDGDASMRPEEIERLAIVEHDRWQAERRAQGWRHGPVRDDGRRRHPDLVSWPELSEASREQARDVVRWLPELLADEGFSLVRLQPASAPAPRLSGR